jgi:hypothetical protein
VGAKKLLAFSEYHNIAIGADELETYLKQLSSFFYVVSYSSAIFVVVFKLY